jgi:hypothetical protein
MANHTGKFEEHCLERWMATRPQQAYSQLFLACVHFTLWRHAIRQFCIIFIPLNQPVSLFPGIVVRGSIRHCSILTGVKPPDPTSPPSASRSHPSGPQTWRSPSSASCSLLQHSVLLLQQCLHPPDQTECLLQASGCIRPHWHRS